MTDSNVRSTIDSWVKPIGWPLVLLIGAVAAVAIGAAISGLGTTAMAVGGDAPKAAKAQAAAVPKPREAGLAGAFLSGRHAEINAEGGLAVDFYNRVTELDPANIALLQNTYFLAVQSGDFDVAIPAALKAYQTSPRRGMAGVLLAMDHVKKGEYAKALPYLEKTQGQTMNSFAMPVMRAWALAPTAPAEQALAELEPLRTFQDTGNVVEAMAGMMNEFYGKKDAALVNYDTLALRIDNERFSTLRIVAEGYHRLGQDNKIKGLFDRFEKTHGTSPTIQAYAEGIPASPVKKITAVEGMAEAMFAASELLLMNDPNELRAQVATAYAQTALFLNPNMDIARRFIGSTLAARNRYDASNDVLSKLKKNAVGYYDVQMQIADNYVRQQKPKEALTALQEVIKDKPQWSEAYVAAGDIQRNKKKYGEAVVSYDNALKYSGDGPQNWAIHYSRGIAHERAKNWDAAENDFKKALELRPDDPNVLNYLGYSYLDRGVKLGEARKLIEGAYKQRPNDGYIIDSFGWALFMNGEYELAVQNLEKAVESAPSDGTINEHLGDAYWKVGRRNEARFQWNRALSFDIEEAQRVTIRTKLERGLAQQ